MSSSTLNNLTTKVHLDEYSSYKWYHNHQNSTSYSNNNRKKSISYLKNGDFYVNKLLNDLSLENSSLPDLNRLNGFIFFFGYLFVFNLF
jgi:hypothetical protein